MGEVAMSGEKMEIQPKNDGVVRWEKFLPRMVMRVLLVEAHDSTRQIITALLRKCNYKVETNMQAGADHGYELLWVILIGLIFALIIQSLAVNLGVTTGKHLAELCAKQSTISS